ncbi:MAG: radical SAM protein [Candidatus Pacebacteria bacterium]|nr:radical SAM protein [Candidatus Paceibacterota bacterium]
MKEKITPHLKRLIDEGSKALSLQFHSVGKNPTVENTEKVVEYAFANLDPLGEESQYSPVKGITHKFRNRALFKVSYRCAAHCQFCTRARQIGDTSGDLSPEEIETALSYIRDHPEINDIILSGGDPLYTPHITLGLLPELAKIKSVKVIRIGTRLPIHSPKSFETTPLKNLLRMTCRISLKKPLYVLINISHFDELTKDVRDVIRRIRKNCTAVFSQTVFLKGINDDVEVMGHLLNELYHMGVIPYYLYRCDYVKGIERYVCSFEKERMIVSEIRRRLSGIAVPEYIIDVSGKGKIPIPLDFWGKVDFSHCRDYDGKLARL